jgi:hypothetical protein
MLCIAIPWDFGSAIDVAAIPGNRDLKHRSSLGFRSFPIGEEGATHLNMMPYFIAMSLASPVARLLGQAARIWDTAVRSSLS